MYADAEANWQAQEELLDVHLEVTKAIGQEDEALIAVEQKTKEAEKRAKITEQKMNQALAESGAVFKKLEELTNPNSPNSKNNPKETSDASKK